MKKRNRLFSLLLALAMVLTYMPALAFANGDGSKDLSKGRICFDGDKDYGWAGFYSVNGKNGYVDDLNITVLDKNGAVIGSEAYDLEIARMLWGEGGQTEIPAQSPFGIAAEDSEGGFSEYVARAKAKDESGYTGSIEATFFIMDAHSLDFVCSDVMFPEANWYDTWAMRSWYWVASDKMDGPVVYSSADRNSPLVEGRDYKVTYYERKCDMDGLTPEDDPQEYMYKDSVKLDSMPQTEGSYIVRVDGIEPYYGGNDILLDIGEYKGPKRIDISGNDDALWSDGSRTLDVKDQSESGITPDFYLIKDGDWGNKVKLTSGKEYTFDNGKLTLYGSKLIQKDEGGFWAEIYAEIKDGDDTLAEGRFGFELREVESWDDFPGDMRMLPEWNDQIDHEINARISNSEYPDGYDYKHTVKNVTVTGQEPAGKTIINLSKDDNNNWKFEAKDYGTATLAITYSDGLDGTEKTKDFTVTVTDAVYKVDLWSESGYWEGLPGDSIELKAQGWKDYVDKQGAPEEWHNEGTDEGLEYNWSIKSGNEFATITENKDDPSEATVTFKDMPEGWDHIGEKIVVEASITDRNSEDASETRASREEDLWVSDEYYQIWPGTIDGSINVGESVSLEPELRSYKLGKEGYKTVDAQFYLENVDQNALAVTEKDGKYTIKRLRERDTDVKVKAEFSRNGKQENREQWYHFDRKNYDVWFDSERYDLYDDYEVTLSPEISEDLESLSDYEIEFKVGRHYNNKPEDQQWESVPESENAYTVKDGSITLYGSKLWSGNDADGGSVMAVLKIEGLDDKESGCWIERCEACSTHDWFTRRTEPTCTESGIEEKHCSVCGEHRTIALPEKGHEWGEWRESTPSTCIKKGQMERICKNNSGHKEYKDAELSSHRLTKTNAVAATYDKTGNIEYWTCSECGKIFKDASGTREITKADTITARLTPKQGDSVTLSSGKYKVTGGSSVSFTGAPNRSSITVPDSVNIGGKVYAVTSLEANAFSKNKATTAVIGKNVKTIKANAFKGSKIKTLTVKSKKLTKKSVKNSLKGSKVKTIKVKVGSKKQNKTYVKKYKKIFTKKNAGKKVSVK